MPNHDSAFRQQILDVAEAQGEPDMGLQPVTLESQSVMNAVDRATIERRIRISQPDEGRGRCKGSRAWVPRILSVHAAAHNTFNVQRHLTSARTHRAFRVSAMQ